MKILFKLFRAIVVAAGMLIISPFVQANQYVDSLASSPTLEVINFDAHDLLVVNSDGSVYSTLHNQTYGTISDYQFLGPVALVVAGMFVGAAQGFFGTIFNDDATFQSVAIATIYGGGAGAAGAIATMGGAGLLVVGSAAAVGINTVGSRVSVRFERKNGIQ